DPSTSSGTIPISNRPCARSKTGPRSKRNPRKRTRRKPHRDPEFLNFAHSTVLSPMAAPQNIIGIVYDYDQTLSPTYMQDEVLFPKFGINPAEFWKRCKILVEEEGYENELAYLKAIID